MLLTMALLCLGLLGTQSLQAKKVLQDKKNMITITLKAKDSKGISRLIIKTADGNQIDETFDWGGLIKETSFLIEKSKSMHRAL